jgi:cytochrome P450
VRHLGFGQGMHMCLGVMLARLEAGVALEGMLDRFATLELTQGPIPWINHGNLRGIERLDVSATAA